MIHNTHNNIIKTITARQKNRQQITAGLVAILFYIHLKKHDVFLCGLILNEKYSLQLPTHKMFSQRPHDWERPNKNARKPRVEMSCIIKQESFCVNKVTRLCAIFFGKENLNYLCNLRARHLCWNATGILGIYICLSCCGH